jgi:hypothetical protein
MPDVLPSLVRLPEVASVVEVAAEEVFVVLTPLIIWAPGVRRALWLSVGVSSGVAGRVGVSTWEECIARERTVG